MASEDLPANGHGGPADPKPALRRERRAARAAFVARLTAAERVALETALAAILTAHLPAGTVAGYHAVGGEIAVDRLARVVLYPRVVRGAPLVFHAEMATTLGAVAGPGGVPEPSATAARGVPDIILVPLLAVDRAGNRLGQGGGHYDRTLAALRATQAVLAVGVAWDMQLVAALPADPWDAPLDALATPSQWLTFPRAAAMSPR